MVGLLASIALRSPPSGADLRSLVAWGLALAVVNLFPIRGWRGVPFCADIPIGLSLGLLFDPAITALVCFLMSVDSREFHREMSVGKALFNRSAVALAWLAASLVAHVNPVPHTFSGSLVLVGALALSANIAMNFVILAPVLVVHTGHPFREAVRHLSIGNTADFLVTYVAFGLLGLILVAVHQHLGFWAPIIFLAPTFLGRLALDRSQLLLESLRANRAGERALTELSRQVGQERRDERRLIAADLHDEVMQPLFKVTLMAQVLKLDLAGGRLLDLDKDLPSLLEAAEVASSSLRDLIGDLRKSSIGTGGLEKALARLLESLTATTEAEIVSRLEEVGLTDERALAIYQIAREASWNAARHSQARHIRIQLVSEGEGTLLQIADDGIGFDPQAQPEDHFGLLIMRERAASAGGSLHLDSAVGRGTTVTFFLQGR